MNEDTKPEDEWDDSLNDLIFGTANYNPEVAEKKFEEVAASKLSFDTSSPMGVYDAINHQKKVCLTFPDKKSAEAYRLRLAQIKSRKDKQHAAIGFDETDSLLFRRLKDKPDWTVEISLGRRGTANYSFTVVSIE